MKSKIQLKKINVKEKTAYELSLYHRKRYQFAANLQRAHRDTKQTNNEWLSSFYIIRIILILI